MNLGPPNRPIRFNPTLKNCKLFSNRFKKFANRNSIFGEFLKIVFFFLRWDPTLKFQYLKIYSFNSYLMCIKIFNENLLRHTETWLFRSDRLEFRFLNGFMKVKDDVCQCGICSKEGVNPVIDRFAKPNITY